MFDGIFDVQFISNQDFIIVEKINFIIRLIIILITLYIKSKWNEFFLFFFFPTNEKIE